MALGAAQAALGAAQAARRPPERRLARALPRAPAQRLCAIALFAWRARRTTDALLTLEWHILL